MYKGKTYLRYRRKFFFEQWGRESYYLLTSGLLQRLNAKEDNKGGIILPEEQCIFDFFDDNYSKKKYESKTDIHIIILHGINEYKKKYPFIQKYFSDKKIHIHYVGKFDFFWNKIENSQILYPFTRLEFKNNLLKIKTQFPTIYEQRYRRTLITLNNFKKNMQLFTQFSIGYPKIIYFGNIKPKNDYITNSCEKFKINSNQILRFFDQIKTYNDLIKKINIFCELKEKIIQNVDLNYYPDLVEFFNIIVRNILCEYLKSFKNVKIYDGKYKNKFFFNAYESYFGKQHIYIDFGVKIGYDEVYPRVDEILRYKNNGLYFLLGEEFFFFDKNKTYEYLEKKIVSLLDKIKRY